MFDPTTRLQSARLHGDDLHHSARHRTHHAADHAAPPDGRPRPVRRASSTSAGQAASASRTGQPVDRRCR